MAYSLSTSYAGEALLSGFKWISEPDPSHGYVSYQTREAAEAQGLWKIDEDTQAVRLGVDHTNVYGPSQGRPSIRIESKEAFNHGLFIADFEHMPPSQCGLWPAFWTYGPNWPNGGEIDIIEGANTAHKNLISAHTSQGCSQDPSLYGLFSGNERDTDCFVGNDNIGCGFDPPSSDLSSYGDGFNAADGGVYAMDWDEDFISIWHFPRDGIPKDIEAKKPNPKRWGRPQAIFGGKSCDVDTYFKDMSIVLNINFCGDYGNALWGKKDSCGSYAPTCPEYVGNNPEAFTNAYWEVNYIDVYSRGHDHHHDHKDSPVTNPETPEIIIIEPSPGSNPERIDNYAHLGCFESDSGFEGFESVAEQDDMTLDTCVHLCGEKTITYAGVLEKTCYCAPEIDPKTRAIPHCAECDSPCPGNDKQFCGGRKPSGDSNDKDSEVCLVTVYAAVVEEEARPVPPPKAPIPDDIKAEYVATMTSSYQPTPGPSNDEEWDSHKELPSKDEASGDEVSIDDPPTPAIETPPARIMNIPATPVGTGNLTPPSRQNNQNTEKAAPISEATSISVTKSGLFLGALVMGAIMLI